MITDSLTTQNNSPGDTSPLSLRTIISHNTLKSGVQEQACYVLLDISPNRDLPTSRLPLNLCLVLDKSTSMQGLRLQQVKEATHQIIDYLQPNDTFSLVVFSDRAEVLLPGQKNIDKPLAKSVVSTTQPSGGTEMLQGLLAGLKEIQGNRSDDSVNHMILLTDGQTYGDEDDCLAQAEWAGRSQVSISTMGIGADWNEDLLDAMANASGGVSTYIDFPRKIVDAFKATITELSTIVAREIILTVTPSEGLTLQEAFQITPHIRRLDISGSKAILGPLGNTGRKTIVMEFRIKTIPESGVKRLARFTVEGDVPTQAKQQSWAWTEVKATISSDAEVPPSIPPVIITTLGKLAIFKMQEKAMEDLEKGNIIAATSRLETMATRLLNLGETELARAALLEAGRLSRTGNLSAEGKKKIRYGTRSLSILPKEIQHD
ncbi:MAG TPA: VWA domain-containing protein [Chloroflexi bacterium]|nr:VWA domain-containing protein [Chloroflexota bacterium]